MIRGLCATFGYKPGVGQGKALIARIMEASHIPGLGEAITSLLTVRAAGRPDQGAGSQAADARRSVAGLPDCHEYTCCWHSDFSPLLGPIDDAGRFRQSRNAGAYFGLVPRRHQSGELDWPGRIAKQGDSMVRKLLYEAAKSILTRSQESFALKIWALKISKRGGLKKARVALARRLAVMHGMLRDGTLFEA
ncbi:transposase [Mesorhizobium sp. M0843]|uniref:transposase n=1 Tax=Mesorhizobium sp. M0843 TaxID=2957010 RepID=UPI00333743A7